MRARRPATGRRAETRGFTLIELVVVVAILAILAGAAVPSAVRSVQKARREATESEMRAIGDALLAHLEDRGVWPSRLSDLVDGGWLDEGFGVGSAVTDGWGSPYLYRRDTETAGVRSLGPDREQSADDPVYEVDGRKVLRARTRDEMETIHVALRAHEIARSQGSASDLPAIWDDPGSANDALGILIDEGLLPDDAALATDAWGNRYVYAGSPSDAVVSTEGGGASLP